jgi:acyl carrier protein
MNQKESQVTTSSSAALDVELRDLLQDILGLSPERANALSAESGLFGELPEFDSMAVATVLTEMEDRLGIQIDDDEVEGEIFETFGNLLAFVSAKTAA